VVSALALGCSSSTEQAASGESNFPLPSTITAPPVAPPSTAPRQACTVATLSAPAAATFAEAALVDVVCETEAAAATLRNGPDGELLVLFTLKDGTWALVANGPVDGDVVALAPSGFSPSAIPAWQRARAARLSRPEGATPTTAVAAAPPSSLQRNSQTGETELCTAYDVDYVSCQSTTIVPPEPTTPPDPEAPPVTSNFCKYNYNDTRCVESNQTYKPRG
jgi:hypothetical protein